MFTSFSLDQPHPISKRPRVRRACNFCREHRVRCDPSTPCSQCIQNNVSCSRLQTVDTSIADTGNNVDQDQADQSGDGERLDHTMPALPPNITGISPPQKQPDDSTSASHHMDSILEFISRINAFCSGVVQLSDPNQSPHDPPPAYTSPFCVNVCAETNPSECTLSNAQISRLHRLFWTRLWPQIPILHRDDLDPTRSDKSYAALRDAITAYCMQYVHYSGLKSRLLGLNWPQFARNRSQTMIGMPYLHRALAATTQFATFAGPSLRNVQCYCFMTLYLLDAGQHQTAYNIIGVAIRMAQSLNLDIDPPPSVPADEAQLRRRIWWTLIHLEFRCSRHIGKPVNIKLHDAMCAPPVPKMVPLDDSNSSSYHTQSLRLTATALALIDSTGYDALRNVNNPGNLPIETRAEVLTNELTRLNQWRRELAPVADLTLDVPDIPPDEEDTGDDDHLHQPPLKTLLSTLLELQYHEVQITLHRVFIQFPGHPLIPKSSPRADAHAATALNHALATIRRIHHRMTQHDVLYGCCEVYQYQWNAVLTLIGFMLAYPYCHRFRKARGHINLALEIFDGAGTHNTAAVRAASLTRHLCGKVDTLVKILNIDERQRQAVYTAKAASASQRRDTVPTQSENAMQAERITDNPQGQDQFELSQQDLPGDDSLWSWVDFINTDAWPTYCDEINEVFMDFSDVDIFRAT